MKAAEGIGWGAGVGLGGSGDLATLAAALAKVSHLWGLGLRA